jgi:exopolysaccharide biosynthesis polyprenyl glycosylphosphotransferase
MHDGERRVGDDARARRARRRGGAAGAAGTAVAEPVVRGTIPPPVAATRPRPAWERNYTLSLVALDAALISLATFVAVVARFGDHGDTLRGVPYVAVAATIALAWVGVLGMSRAYESRFVGVGSEEFRRVFDASVRLLALVATVAFTFRLPLARGFVGVAFPLGTALLCGGRYGARRVLHGLRARGRAVHRVVVVGARESVEDVIRQACDARHAGLLVVGACVPDTEHPVVVDGLAIPTLGTPVDAARCVVEVGADTVAVAGGWAMGSEGVRRLAWQLEGSGIDLVVAPSLTNVAGPRITVRPVAGLALLHVEEPEFTGMRRLFKGAYDRAVALVLLLLAGPFLLALAAAIKLTDRGPVFFSQERVGINGKRFRLWKLRSMYVDAEARRAELAALNETDAVLFKIRRDPRVTPVGRVLRRFSLDELPQLLNVLKGDMSLVGPRPPLPSEVEEYHTDVRRRLLVKPGVTGLWQVSGRADLTWEESVRLDLHYVENWSVALDFMILWKTFGAVVHGRGAY